MESVARHELEPLRRSLAIGNGLPSDQILRLLATCDELYRRLEALEALEAVRAEIRALRPIVAELRARLRAVDDAVRSAGPGPTSGRGRDQSD